MERVLTEQFETVEPDVDLVSVVRRMRETGADDTVVVEGDEPVGVITYRDVAVRTYGEDRVSDDLTAEDVMTPDPVTITTDVGLIEAARMMSDTGVRRLPVVDSEGSLLGMLEAYDLTRLVADELSEMLDEVIEAQRPRY